MIISVARPSRGAARDGSLIPAGAINASLSEKYPGLDKIKAGTPSHEPVRKLDRMFDFSIFQEHPRPMSSYTSATDLLNSYEEASTDTETEKEP